MMEPENDFQIPEEPRPERPDRTIWYIVGGLVLLWIGYLAICGPRTGGGIAAPDLTTDPGLGQADFSWRLEELDGSPLQLERYRGRPIFLNIWATWCGPCLMEMPSIENLVRNPRLAGVVFLGISGEDASVLRSFVAAQRPGLTILRTPELPPGHFLADAIPATFLIAPDGRIVASHVGAARWDDPAVVDRLAELAAEAEPEPAPEPTATAGLDQDEPWLPSNPDLDR